jgi:hypothetical protein
MKRFFRGYGIALALIIIINILKFVSIIFIYHLRISSCKEQSSISFASLRHQIVKNNTTKNNTFIRT